HIGDRHIRLLFFFFFSSRRRHTRSKRDWSSDVCSSDLSFRVATEPKYHRVFWYPGLAHHWAILLKHPLQDFGTSALNHRLLLRSKCPKDRDLVWAAESGTWPQRCQVA